MDGNAPPDTDGPLPARPGRGATAADALPLAPRIHLVRHGRSAHAVGGWLDAHGVRRWLADYDTAGIMDDDHPPEALRALAAGDVVVVASDLARARASAERLAPGGGVIVSPLLRETPLPIPALAGVRLPLAAWAIAIGLHEAVRRWRGAAQPREAGEQAAEAAAWLAGLAERHGAVVAVTHGAVRPRIAAALGTAGWRREPGGRRYAHWSVWALARPVAGDGAAGARW